MAPFFPLSSCTLILLSRSKQLSFTLLTWPAAWKPRGARNTECDFKGEMLGERKKRNTQVPFLQIKWDAREHSALVTAEVCVEPGEFCLYSLVPLFLLVTTVLNSRAMTEMKTSMPSGAVWDDTELPACWSRRTQGFQGQKPPVPASRECFRHPKWSPAAPHSCTKVTESSFWTLGSTVALMTLISLWEPVSGHMKTAYSPPLPSYPEWLRQSFMRLLFVREGLVSVLYPGLYFSSQKTRNSQARVSSSPYGFSMG